MKIEFITDIHLENIDSPFPKIGEGDLLVLAGNILIAKHFKSNEELKEKYITFFEKCLNNYNNILYVMGNCEHYGYHFQKTYETLKKNLPSSIKLLENEKVIINEYVFIGMTLWTDFEGDKNKKYCVETLSNDYEVIRTDTNYRKLKTLDVINAHNNSKKYLNKELKNHRKDKVFIVTHHAPSFESLSIKDKSKLIHTSFYSDMSKIINRYPQINYWIHGHVDTENDYIINKCRILSNTHGNFSTLDIT